MERKSSDYGREGPTAISSATWISTNWLRELCMSAHLTGPYFPAQKSRTPRDSLCAQTKNKSSSSWIGSFRSFGEPNLIRHPKLSYFICSIDDFLCFQLILESMNHSVYTCRRVTGANRELAIFGGPAFNKSLCCLVQLQEHLQPSRHGSCIWSLTDHQLDKKSSPTHLSTIYAIFRFHGMYEISIWRETALVLGLWWQFSLISFVFDIT